MLVHPQEQGRQEATGEAVGPVQPTAICPPHALHRQALLGEPEGLPLDGLAQIPAARTLAQQHLGGEIVAFRVGQAQQIVHRCRVFLVHQNRIARQGRPG